MALCGMFENGPVRRVRENGPVRPVQKWPCVAGSLVYEISTPQYRYCEYVYWYRTVVPVPVRLFLYQYGCELARLY